MKRNTDNQIQLPGESRSAKAILSQFFITLWNTFKALLKYVGKLNQVWNEAWLLIAGYFALHYVPVFLPEPTHRFFYASLGTVAAHFMITLMLRLSHPLIHTYLYGLFYNDLYEKSAELKSNTVIEEKKHTRMKYSLLVVLLYLGTWIILAVTC
jgi:uncharacterized membrane protein YgaE (UPF0421/DUF939 family)